MHYVNGIVLFLFKRVDHIDVLRVGRNLNKWIKDQMLEMIITIAKKCNFFDLQFVLSIWYLFALFFLKILSSSNFATIKITSKMSSFTKASWELLNVGGRTFLKGSNLWDSLFEWRHKSESLLGLKSLGFLSTFFLGMKLRFHWLFLMMLLGKKSWNSLTEKEKKMG